MTSESSPGDQSDSHLRLGHAFLVLLGVPIVASGILLVALRVIKDEKTEVALPIGIGIGFVVLVASAVTRSAVATTIRGPSRQAASAIVTARESGLSTSQGIVLLLTFVVLTAVPAAVVVAATSLLRRNENLFPEFALPVILLVGLIGLLAVLAMMVAVFRRLNLASNAFPLGLPEGSIQAVIALSLILIFAIIGVYLHATANGEQKEDLSTQLLTTVSTLVVAVAGFYFGSKTTKEAAESVARNRGDGGTVVRPPEEGPPKPSAGGAAVTESTSGSGPRPAADD